MAERTGNGIPLGGSPPGGDPAGGAPSETDPGGTGPSAVGPPAGRPRRGRLPFRRKMDLLVVLPTVAMALLMTPVGVHEVGVAGEWNTAASFLASTKSVSQLIQDLSLERDKAQAAMNGEPEKARAYNDAIGVTDTQVLVVSKAFGAKATPTLTAALAAVGDLSYVRELPASKGLSQDYVVQARVQQLVDTVYGAINVQLVTAVDFAGHAAAGGPASSLETELASLYAGDMAESQREASLTAFASEPSVYNAAEQYNAAVRNDEVATGELGFVAQFPAAADRAALVAVLRSPEAQTFREYQTRLEATFGSAFQDPRGVIGSPKNLDDLKTLSGRNTLTAAFEAASNQRAATEAQITDRIIDLSRSNARQAEFTVAIMIGIGVLAAGALMALSALIRRSVVRPVLALTRAAGRVAKAAAADLERVTDEDLGADGELPDFEAIPVPTDDELGDLALAFNKVQETALLMLERQVTIRRNTAEMFGNVGHRIHNLTGRQLSIIDQVERTETDPVLLDRMYRIDHLAVRLQRGADSLVLLSGEREANISGAPMRLTDVVRSAVGRVEGYQRVVLIAEDDAMVAPSAVGDLTLMVAELVENAVSFSPASQRVEIAVALSARGFVIEIVDRGMGMSPEQMAQENARLVRRERLDLAPTRVLGLFVVGRLSVRTGAAVELSPTPGGGTTARVYVPGFLLAGPVADGSGPRALRGDAAEAAATGTPAVTAGPGGNGVPALPGAAVPAALMPGQPQHSQYAQDQSQAAAGAWPISAVAPAVGPDGLPRRIPGASQPTVEAYGQPLAPNVDTVAGAGAGAFGAQPGAIAGSRSGSGDHAIADYAAGPLAPAAFTGADGIIWPEAAGAVDGQVTSSGWQAPGSSSESSQSSSSQSSSSQSSQSSPPPLSSLQVSGLDAIALPVPSDAPGARYSLGPLAPVPVDGGLGRRRAGGGGGGDEPNPPHQPLPEPRRESEHLPSRLSPVRPQPRPAPAPEASPWAHPQPEPQPRPSRPPASPASAAQSATAPQPADNALPRRVRKAPPAQPDWPTAPMSAVPAGPVSPQDPAAVRDALLEYEAGVERALHDSADDMPSRRQAARHAGQTTPERDGEDQ